MHGKGMKALPTYGVIPAINVILKLGKEGHRAPGLEFGLDRVLHGEQYTELKRPLPRAAKLTHRGRVKDIFDKGKNALVVQEIVSYDEAGNELVRNEITTLVRGAGGWGGDRGPSADVNVPPDRAPDKVIEEKVPAHQALLYRLSGDWNPLHADPGMAKAFGFDKPILHGLCSFGYAGRHVIAGFAPEGNPDFMKSIRVRFAKTVLPGDTLVTEMWKESDQKIVFQTKVKERNEVVISNAAVEFWKEIPKPAAKPKAAAAGGAAGGAGAASAMPISADIFNAMNVFVKANADVAEKVKTVFQFKLSGPDSVWTIDLGTPPGSVTAGAGTAPKCTLELSDADFMAMATGQADPMKLFSTGKLKISGDVMASQKLGFLKKITPDLVMAEMKKRVGAAVAAAAGGGRRAVAARRRRRHGADDLGRVHRDPRPRRAQPRAGREDRRQLPVQGDQPRLGLGHRPEERQGRGHRGPRRGRLHARDQRGRLHRHDDRQVGPDEAVHDRQAEDQRQRDGVAEAQLPAEDGSRAGQAGGDQGARGGRRSGQGQRAAAAGPTAKAPAFFAALGKRLAEKPELAKELGAIVLFKIVDPGSEWTVEGAAVSPADFGTAKTTITLKDEDLAGLSAGDVYGLYQHGKLRVDGDVSVAHRLGLLKGLL
jgi:3-hydroxyacyl-CoA dehydrogenase/3a,7a,12a-trihydroxy-5b-cholest-24-enoyl-CoA hydratase